MNGWFPHINYNKEIISGNADIWITPTVGDPYTIGQGFRSIWQGLTPVYGKNDGTTQVGKELLNTFYGQYEGSDGGNWAGFNGGGGQIDIYQGTHLIDSIVKGCIPRFGKTYFGFLYPYQPDASGYRQLYIDDIAYADGILTEFQIGDNDVVVWQVATGTYTRQLWSKLWGVDTRIDIRDDETPRKVFAVGNETWMMNETHIGTFIRPIDSPYGYIIHGDLYYPDARMIGDKLRVVGSYANGTPRFDIWIDFNTARVDLRTVTDIPPPIIDPVPPDTINPGPDPSPPISELPRPEKFGKITELTWK